MSLIYNATFDSQTRILSLLDKAGNVTSSCEVPSKKLVDDIAKPLMFRATQDGSTVKLTKYNFPSGSFQTSRDGGNTWTDYTLDSAITLNTGDEVSFRAKSDRTSAQAYNKYFYFEMTGKIEAWHNVMSLYRTNDFATYNATITSAFYHLFDGCASLTKAPALPATTLADNCYDSMFHGCTSLTKAPELPATKLTNSCYYRMFHDCTSLTEAPELTATTLVQACYFYMFNGCSSLNEVHCKIPSSYSSSDISSKYATRWLDGVLSAGTFYTNADANWPSGVNGIPEGWDRFNEGDPTLDDIAKPLMFRATQDGSVRLTKNGSPSGSFQTSRDGGNTWTDYTPDTAITLKTGDEVSFRAKEDRTSNQTSNDYFQFKMTGKIEAWHNVMSLYRTNDFATYRTATNYSFHLLFKGCTSLTKAPALPATTLADSCYDSMFHGCTSLTKAPRLIATTLVVNCYNSMFYDCTSLTKAPRLLATTLSQRCCSCMFFGCTSLVNAPVLPATTLAVSCYEGMFWGCTSMTGAPELPATALVVNCYNSMFYGCTSLTKAPALPATTLADSCYGSMFSGCTSLTEAPELTATTLANNCYTEMFNGCSSLSKVRCHIPSSYSSSDISSKYASNWLLGVSSTGTFYTNADENWPSGASGIPENWNRVNEGAPSVDDIAKPLTFRATQDGSTVSLTSYYGRGAFQTSRDGGNTWTDYTIGTAITLKTGDEVSFRAKEDRTLNQTSNNYFYFKMTGKIEAWHNVMSLYRTNDFATYNTVGEDWFTNLFSDCTSLVKAPALPATTLDRYCYNFMFDGCTSLTKSPELPATTLASDCYRGMFNGCSSLIEVRCRMPSSYSSGRISGFTNGTTQPPYPWLSGVSSTGTFYTNADANWPSGADGIPTGWTRVST